MIHIDGSSGEGGGQILRSSLSLSLVTGKPFRIENIRAGRERSGLLRQHLTAVLAATEISGANAEGVALGSKTLRFTPGEIRHGTHRFAVGTAGSSTLVLQTILPALMTAAEPSHITIEGGTHNMHAPPFDFLEKVFLPVVNRLGPKISVNLSRYGFYPAGGGSFAAAITPCTKLAPVELLERGEIGRRFGRAIVANLSRSIGRREMDVATAALGWDPGDMEVIQTRDSVGPGNIVLLEIVSVGITEVFSGFGRLGASAELVAGEAVKAVRSYLASGAAACEHLADQLLLPFALAGGGSFTAEKLNLHARTNMSVIKQFLPVDFVVGESGTKTTVEIRQLSEQAS
ncbi:MAG TPA: RNA 3'-terminal phosphate cyclase [Candidatus Acidoferrales bacterium]